PDRQQRAEQDDPENRQVAGGDAGVPQVGERVVVGRGRETRSLPVRSAGRDRPARVDGEDGQPPVTRLPGLKLDAGRLVVHVLERGGVPAQQEGLVVVVHRERAARREVRLGRGERLLGQQVAFQPERRLPGQRGHRVGQRQQDQVVPLVRAFQVGAAVI